MRKTHEENVYNGATVVYTDEVLQHNAAQVSPAAKDLITRLLDVNPRTRLTPVHRLGALRFAYYYIIFTLQQC